MMIIMIVAIIGFAFISIFFGGGMMGGGMMGGMMGFGWLFMLFPILFIIFLIYALLGRDRPAYKQPQYQPPDQSPYPPPYQPPYQESGDPMLVLEQRYASGEISRDEYLRIREDIYGR
jgi:uncharacterized membrane protein